ncbi:putative adsorbtion associated protein [Bacillus phage Shanette]|uniref:Adsorbtion associated protein n=1 Tax=Bacillus phage Shanette TaxID=1296656 RepID=S5MTB8_9CAUD|nr:putative adsorbtion associated protein [Bacillus phage Shanette]AGR47007.1 putative adsorbtion associated protein [Bacillus phage Shanette]
MINKDAPYYDDFDPTKKYSKISFVPGRVAQAREFTQMQTIMYEYLKRVSDTLYRDGSVVSGMGWTLTSNTIKIEAGKVYLKGVVHLFDAQEIPITKKGKEIVGVKLKEEIITEANDISLTDPALNMGNYGQPGAHRVKSSVELKINDPDASPIYEFNEGELQLEMARPQFDSGLMDMLAKRTKDTNGNYRVVGLDLSAEEHDANNMRVIVEAGTAYIMGYEVIKVTPVKKIIPKALDTRVVQNEPQIYLGNQDKYPLNNAPAKRIDRVSGEVQITETVTRGATINGMDSLSKTPVADIVSITGYTKGADYQLSADKVDWGVGGVGALEPATGSTYSVTYKYRKNFVDNTDYKLTTITDGWGVTKDYIQWLAGDKPVNNTQVNLDYQFYLPRADLVSIDRYGNVIVTQGQSDVESNVVAPQPSSDEQLVLGAVYINPGPNNKTAKTKFNAITRMEMGEIQRLARRVDDLEYNQAITALDRDAMAGELPSDLKGIFSDSFRSVTRGDLSHPNFNIMYSLEDGVIMLPTDTTKDIKPNINMDLSNVKSFGRLIGAPMNEVVGIEQPYATQSMLVNPYLSFNVFSSLKLTPASDNWVDESYIKIENTEYSVRNFYRWWGHPEAVPWVQDLLDLKMDDGRTVGDWRPPWTPGETVDTSPRTTVSKVEKSRSILEDAITVMRQIDIEIFCENLQPSADNLELTFDGVRVSLTPVKGSVSGANPGTVRANSSGQVWAKFRIPAGVKTGTREVMLRNSTNSAVASFTSIGTKRTVTDTILTKRITLVPVDPLAQTFEFDRDTLMTSVGVYFSAKHDTKPCTVQIRNVVNGYPSNVIYAEKVLQPSDIKTSSNAILETKITFDDPVMCQANIQYCIVVLSDNDKHSMWVCDLGQKDVTTGVQVTQQPYLIGMLFSSKNAKTWTAHQSMNMKFKVYKAEFQPTGVIEFDPISNLGADRLVLLADYLVPANTGCIWEVSLDDGMYVPLANYEPHDLSQIVSKVKLKATFKSEKNMSPLMSKDSFTLVGFMSGKTGSYLGRTVEMPQIYTTVKQTYDAHLPAGCTVTPQFSYDDGATWITPPLVSSQQVSSDYIRYNHEVAVPANKNAKKFKARLNLSTPNAVIRPTARRFINIMK